VASGSTGGGRGQGGDDRMGGPVAAKVVLLRAWELAASSSERGRRRAGTVGSGVRARWAWWARGGE
jgi:hypothetical protein